MCHISDLKRYGAQMESWLAERRRICLALRTTSGMRKNCWLFWRQPSAVNEELVSSLLRAYELLEKRRPRLPR